MTAGQPKRIAILGSTGSIGRSTLDVIRHFPDRFRVEAMAAGSNGAALAEQVREFRPRIVGLADVGAAGRLRDQLASAPFAPEVLAGPAAMCEIARLPEIELVVNGLVGSRGLLPTLTALEAGTAVALANKEPLVVAGELIMETAARRSVELLPLDSELSAIHQCLRGNTRAAVERVILTASGGPFRSLPAADFSSIEPADALSHPTWEMGPKITVDSATLMNKGLEIIETHWYFGVPYDRIEVVVHPQSLVHSLVEFVDLSVMAQVSDPDMRLPIQYVLTHPERRPSPVARLDLVRNGPLTFEEPDPERFPCLRLAREAGEAGGLAPAVLNAANEVAVEAFLKHEIGFPEIPVVIEECLSRGATSGAPTLENLREIDVFTRQEARELVRGRLGGVRVQGNVS
jgi:1-deoxy-D-xylulose-5-phosphate reductoisomerase